jgi:hypothetical protein
MTSLLKKLKATSPKLADMMGDIYLFAVVKRVDLENKWDLVFSASKITADNDDADLRNFIDLMKIDLSEDFFSIESILVLPVTSSIVHDIVLSVNEAGLTKMQPSSLYISENITINEITLIEFNVEANKLVQRKTNNKQVKEVATNFD